MDPDVFMTMGQEGWRQNKIVDAVWRIGSKGRQKRIAELGVGSCYCWLVGQRDIEDQQFLTCKES